MTASSPRPGGTPAGYAALFDSLPDAVLVVGSDGLITQVNAAAERLFGDGRFQLVDQDHRMLLAEGYRSGFDRLFASLHSESGDIAAAKTPSAPPWRPPLTGSW
ncbi:PAS domain-containing protein [Arthrobacter sp. SAFR-014]|uniref:PAS domain-containing protein n=1 Tax=unclassified Arthrobacter TaxID=235627 RepID=UPI003F7BEBA3